MPLTVPLTESLRVEELHLLVGEDIDLVQDAVQLSRKLVGFLIQESLVQDAINELSLHSDQLIEVSRLLDVILEYLPGGLKHLNHNVVVDG